VRINGDNVARWPGHLAVGAVRFARPTAHYDETLVFYRDALGLPVLAQWRGHDGYDGAVFGLPGTPCGCGRSAGHVAEDLLREHSFFVWAVTDPGEGHDRACAELMPA
jgi:catechol 2,3-dioxygenase-like lactoylglutathione lyase family enzyme